MTAPNIQPILYRREVSLSHNIDTMRKHFRLTNEDFGKAIGMSAAGAGMYIKHHFRTQHGSQNQKTKALKAYLDRFFIGGIPDEALKQEHRQDLYTLFKCAKCRYRMKSQHGCIKFSLTKAEINHGAYIVTLSGGGYSLSAKNRCPHAR